jgi:hypothetical protein
MIEDTKKLVLLNVLYILTGYVCDKVEWMRKASERAKKYGLNAGKVSYMNIDLYM